MAFVIALVIVTHGQLGQEFINVLNHVMGPQEKVAAFALEPKDTPAQRYQDLVSLVESLQSKEGVIVLTDMFGGTPSNMALMLQDQPNLEIIAGINLPLLLKLATVRTTMPLKEAILEAQTAGRKYIHVASELLKQAS